MGVRIIMSVQLNPELYERLQEAADILDIPRSVLIRWAIRDYVDTILEGGTLDNGSETAAVEAPTGNHTC